MVLRASSLAAVTILVWSTRLKPISTARCRTAWRTMTTCSEVVSGSVSADTKTIVVTLRGVERRGQQFHAAFHVERRADARQRESELDQRDRDRGAHADHDRLRVEHPRHRRDIAQHPADEGID